MARFWNNLALIGYAGSQKLVALAMCN